LNFSMLSMKEAKGDSSSKCSVAVYKGLTVTVYTVDKAELTLSRRDLVDLVNVCRPYVLLIRRGVAKSKNVGWTRMASAQSASQYGVWWEPPAGSRS